MTPKGWKLVPDNPSPEMLAAAWDAWKSRHGGKLGPGPAFAEAVSAAIAASPPPPVEVSEPRREVNDEQEILSRLASGDTIVYSQDGDAGWFTAGDRAFVGNVIMDLREKGYLQRCCDDEENYRGLSEYDTISDAGRAALSAIGGQDDLPEHT